MLLFANCGQRHDAQNTIKEFVENNLTDGYQLREMDVLRVDSTKHVNDSIVNSMRKVVQAEPQPYKSKVEYCQTEGSNTLMACRTQYKINDKTYSGVFYLDKSMTGVIAFFFNKE